MAFDAYDRSIKLLRALTRLIKTLRSHDAELTKQLRRAAQSIAQNISEANRRVGKDRRHLFRIALGSAAETATCLEIAVASEYLVEAEISEVNELLDRIRAMTYRLSTR